jgi:uncharacterized membrane protein YfcA
MAAKSICPFYDCCSCQDDNLVLLFFIGLVSGMLGGMGIGGGTIQIPSLIFLVGVSQHTAQGINLASFIPTALAAIIVHSRNKRIRFKLAFQLVLSGTAGALTGSLLASCMSASLLRKLFGGFLLVIGIYELLRKDRKKEK